MRILLYCPDNGVTRNFMPHLWMFLLKSLTPPQHEVLLIDGNTQPMTDADLVRYALDRKIGLAGIGAMTRMIAKAYRVADALLAAGVPVVMGGPHVTEAPGEALGREGGARHADAVALGEADETWSLIVEDAAAGRLKETYAPRMRTARNASPALTTIPKYRGSQWISTSSTASPVFSRPSCSNCATPGRRSTSSRSNPGGDAPTAATSVR
jgi:radical SAM superfamily enzyme YgiQ (UPF0313 family)